MAVTSYNIPEIEAYEGRIQMATASLEDQMGDAAGIFSLINEGTQGAAQESHVETQMAQATFMGSNQEVTQAVGVTTNGAKSGAQEVDHAGSIGVAL